jgi:hypothetical protein
MVTRTYVRYAARVAPGRIRLELIRIQREIRRAAELQDNVRAVLDRASEDHKRVMRELGFVKNKHLRDELLELAHRIQLEGQTIRELSG